MSAEFPRSDSRPWYRQFWPWFLISLPATVVVAGFITLYIAHSHSDDLVVDEYYRDGLGINRQLEKKQRAVALGIAADLTFAQKKSSYLVNVRVSGNNDQGELKLSLSHPLESDRDFVLILQEAGPGIYSAEFDNAIATRWHWILDFVGSTSWRLDGSIENSDFSDESFQ